MNKHKQQAKSRAFSLIEILIVLGIIAIISILSFPHFKHYMIDANRTEAKSSLLRLASAMDKYFYTAATYRGATLAILQFPSYVANNTYKLSIQHTSNTHFLLTATPMSKYADEDCGTLEIDSKRRRNASGTASLQRCWG